MKGLFDMPVFMFFLPILLGLTVYRMYIESIWLRKVCRMKKRYIVKHNTGSLPLRLIFWNMKYDVDMIPYFLFLSCFIVPFLLPVLWLIAGNSGVAFYYSLCLLIFGLSALLTLQRDRVRFLVGKRRRRKPENRKVNLTRNIKLALIYTFGITCTLIGAIGVLP